MVLACRNLPAAEKVAAEIRCARWWHVLLVTAKLKGMFQRDVPCCCPRVMCPMPSPQCMRKCNSNAFDSHIGV